MARSHSFICTSCNIETNFDDAKLCMHYEIYNHATFECSKCKNCVCADSVYQNFFVKVEYEVDGVLVHVPKYSGDDFEWMRDD